MRKAAVTVTVTVEVELDEGRFTEGMLREFRASFYPFYTVEDHIEHIAQLEARGLLGEFVEGYGLKAEFGIAARVLDIDTEIKE